MMGDDKQTELYVRLKKKKCEEYGFEHKGIVLSKETTELQVIQQVQKLNDDHTVSGILIQLPLSPHINTDKVLGEISPEKDVDGLRPMSEDEKPLYVSCTAKGCIYIIQESVSSVKGNCAVVLGQSHMIGKPVTYCLKELGANVIPCKGDEENIRSITRKADILVAAVEVPNVVKGDWIKPGALVVDSGSNLIDNGKVVGDVNFEEAVKVAGKITPVPGGVGPMIIAMLMDNLFLAWKRKNFK